MGKINKDSKKLISEFSEELYSPNGFSGDVNFKIMYLDKLLKSDYSIRTMNQTISLLSKISKWEDLFEKDFYNFDIDETKLIFKDLKRPTLAALSSEKSILDKYLYFAVDNKKSKTARHPSFNIKGEDLNEFVNTKSRKNKFITYNEYLELLENCINPQDEAFIILLWNGAYDKNLEAIRNIKTDDIDETNRLIKNLNVNLTKKEFDTIIKAKNQLVFLDEISDVAKDLSRRSQYLFKACGRDKDEPISQVLFINRFAKITAKINNRDLKVKSIVSSGIFYRAKEMFGDIKKNKMDYYKYMVDNKISRSVAKDIQIVLEEKYFEENSTK